MVPLLTFWGANLVVYWSGWTTVWKLMVAVLIGFVLLALFVGSGQMKGKSLDVRAGLWVFPWLAGLTVISFIGNYPEPIAGILNDPSSVVSTLLLLVLSVVVYVIAYRFRLSPEETRAHIDETRHEAAVEEEQLGDAH